MKEVRNLKGEIVSSVDLEDRWYGLNSSTWLLMGGLILFNIGCFVHPGLIDGLFRCFDVRLWPWWYIVCVGTITAFAVRWFLICQFFEEYDARQREIADRFLRMSILISVLMGICILLHATTWINLFYQPAFLWYNYGTMSAMGFVSFVLPFALGAVVLYYVKEWFVSHWEEY